MILKGTPPNQRWPVDPSPLSLLSLSLSLRPPGRAPAVGAEYGPDTYQ
jgi:hypothetical protein